MKRNLKIVGMAIAAVFAMSAFAGGAQAAEFHSEAEHTTLHAAKTTVHTFSNGVFDVTCEDKATFHGTTLKNTVTKIKMSAEYDGCHVIILFTFAATVNMNGCEYEFESDGDIQLVCPVGKKIVISSSGCTIEVGSQEIKGGASYKSEGSGKTRTVTVTSTAKKIKYNQSGSSCSTKSGEDAEYTGSAKTTGENTAGEQVGVWFE